MYQCSISFEGDNIPENRALWSNPTINGSSISADNALFDLSALENTLIYLLDSLNIGYISINVLSNNNGYFAENLFTNVGRNRVSAYIFYPSVALTGSIEVTINGTPQTFTFEKVATV